MYWSMLLPLTAGLWLPRLLKLLSLRIGLRRPTDEPEVTEPVTERLLRYFDDETDGSGDVVM
jgi:hypothetical protein